MLKIKQQKYGSKKPFSKKSKRGYKRSFFICFRQVSIERIQTRIIHIPPCSQKIIDNENPIFLRFFEDAMVTTIGNVVLSVHIF